MKFSSTLIAAAAAFLPLIEAHVKMCDPAPYGFNNDNAPLAADGSNFPCKMPAGTLATTYSSAKGPVYMPGQANKFQLQGSAVHGGGSCQISITYDNPPTKDSKFKVIQSYEGACPIFTEGNLPADPTHKLDPFDVQFPDGLKAGPATFVWSWFNKIGNREMYMDCAPVTIGGNGNSMDVFNSLPDMFVANIQVPQSKCTTLEKVDILFPNPGKNLVKSTDACNFQPACGGSAGGSTDGNTGGSTGGNTGGDSGMYTPPVAAPTEAPIPGNGNGGAFVGVPTTVYNAPPKSVYTPIAGSPSTTMSTVAAQPTGSYGDGSSSGGSSSGGSSDGSSSGGSSSGPSYGNGGSTGGSSGSSGPSYGSGGSMSGGNGSAPAGTCDGSWVIKCDDADPTHFMECYGKDSMMQKMPCNPGMTCTQIAAAHAGSFNKFRRHAHEHLKRAARSHKRY